MTGPLFDWIQDKWYRVNEYFEGFPDGRTEVDEYFEQYMSTRWTDVPKEDGAIDK